MILIYIIYICVCVCVCIERERDGTVKKTVYDTLNIDIQSVSVERIVSFAFAEKDSIKNENV